MRSRIVAAAVLTVCAAGPTGVAAQPSARLQVPVEYYKLPNGLKVVLSRDTTTPTACVAVYYNIGFRNEPKDRTGFAHLFEHMMFQGSANLGKMEFIRLVESNGGLLNGSTRFDFTNYFQVVPSHVLETVLWAEADRMRGLAIDAGEPQEPAGRREERGARQRAQPAVWRVPLDRPADGRERELVQRAQLLRRPRSTSTRRRSRTCAAFFKTFYAPNNAVLVVPATSRPRRPRRGCRSTSPASRRRSCRRRPTCASRDRRRRSAPSASTRSPPVRRSASRITCRPVHAEWYAFGLIDQSSARAPIRCSTMSWSASTA